MGTSDRDRAIEEALAGRAPADHPDLEPVAAFAAELRERAERVPVRPSPAVASLLRGEKDLATYVELDTERTRRRPAAIWAAAAAVAVALGGVAVAQPWDSGGNTPTAASVTAPVETSATVQTATAPSTSLAPATTAEPIVTTTVLSPPATAAATVPRSRSRPGPRPSPRRRRRRPRPVLPKPPRRRCRLRSSGPRSRAGQSPVAGVRDERPARGSHPRADRGSLRQRTEPRRLPECPRDVGDVHEGEPQVRADRDLRPRARPGGLRLRAARLAAPAVTQLAAAVTQPL